MKRRWISLMIAAVAACQGNSNDGDIPSSGGDQVISRRDEPPVPLDPIPPIEYPPGVIGQGQSGTLMLRLFADSTGRVVPESTAIHESSGIPALDSAARQGAPRLRYAPALRDGSPIPTAFLQPMSFRPRRRGGRP